MKNEIVHFILNQFIEAIFFKFKIVTFAIKRKNSTQKLKILRGLFLII